MTNYLLDEANARAADWHRIADLRSAEIVRLTAALQRIAGPKPWRRSSNDRRLARLALEPTWEGPVHETY